MPFETINMEEITEARRKAIAGSIRTISLEELKAEEGSAFAQRLDLASALALVVGGCADILISEFAREHAIDQQGELAGGGVASLSIRRASLPSRENQA